jgi:carboxyl-terminal processing protease
MNRLISSYVIIILSFLAGCTKIILHSSSSDHVLEDFETLWKAVDNVYPLLEYKSIDWDSIYVSYYEETKYARGDESYKIVYELLKELKDPHVYFVNPGGGVVLPYPGHRWLKDREAYDPLIVRSYFDKQPQFACREKVEYVILNDETGYIYISNFDDEDAMIDFGDVINYMQNTSGLIIDIRNNTGGWTDNISVVISKFITETLPFVKGYIKNEIEYIVEPVQPDESIIPYQKPIVILMNGATISAGEIFAEMMNQLPNVTLVGDTTNGAGCNDAAEGIEGDYILPSGIRIHIGTTYAVKYDGQPIELNGIVPEVLITQTKEDLENGNDLQLEYAIQLL